MTAIIIIGAVVLASIIFIVARHPDFAMLSKKFDTNSIKLKTASFILIGLNLYSLVKTIILVANQYSSGWVSNADSMLIACAQIFQLTTILLSLLLGIFLLTKLNKFATLSSIALIMFTLADNLFAKKLTIYEGYFTFLPLILVLLSLIFITHAISGKSEIFFRYKKFIILTPYSLLLAPVFSIINVVLIAAKNKVDISYLIYNAIFNFVLSALPFVVFLLVFKTLVPLIEEQDTSNTSIVTTKEKIIVISSVALFPIVIGLLSNLPKGWLFAATIAIVVFISIAFVKTFSENKKIRTISLICATAIAIILSVVSLFIPQYQPIDRDGIPGWHECSKCESTGITKNDSGIFITCPRCKGVGLVED